MIRFELGFSQGPWASLQHKSSWGDDTCLCKVEEEEVEEQKGVTEDETWRRKEDEEDVGAKEEKEGEGGRKG